MDREQREEALFMAMDNFHVEQLRMENHWLRQRLDDQKARVRPFHGPARILALEGDQAHVRGCQCGLCQKN